MILLGMCVLCGGGGGRGDGNDGNGDTSCHCVIRYFISFLSIPRHCLFNRVDHLMWPKYNS